MARKYLVTGGSGFIGAALVRRLVHNGDAVRVLDNESRGAARRLKSVADDIEMVVADIRDGSAVEKAATGMDSIVHLAFVNGTEFFYRAPELVLDVGVRGMLNVIDACRSRAIEDLVLASSSEVYQTPTTVPTDETAALVVPDVHNPRYSYGAAKIISEVIAINYGRKDFARVVIFRPHNVYGPDMGWEHVIPQFILRALDEIEKTAIGKVPFRLQGDGSQTRSFMYIDDCAAALTTILERGGHQEIYHVGNPHEITIADLARSVVAYFGRDIELIEGELPPGQTMRRCPDISKLRSLGFTPRVGLDEGLPPTAEWYRAHRHLRREPSTVRSEAVR